MKIVLYPHPSLRHKARPLTSIDKQVHLQAGEMLNLMYEAKGVGLAATQVALEYQLLVMNASADPEKKDQELVLINPVILERSGVIEGDEGCLSFPGLFQKVRRAKMVKVQAYNLQGKAIEVVPGGNLASRVLQHEIDHLSGILYIDKMGPIARLASRSALKELEHIYRKAQERGEIPPDQAMAM